MEAFLERRWRTYCPWNIAIGVSVENQATADDRVPTLLATPAETRFLSVEPLLDKVEILPHWISRPWPRAPSVHWVIVGGESGPQARDCRLDHIRLIVEQCRRLDTAVFVKQLGRRPVVHTESGGIVANHYRYGISDSMGGEPADWPEDLRVREFPVALQLAGEPW